MSNKLIIGCGVHTREGWLSLDPDPEMDADFLGGIPPVPGNVAAIPWSQIEWIHGITSLYPWDAATALRELFAILEPGGRLTLEQPNFLKARTRVEWLFGDGRLERPLLMNRWSWEPESLVRLLRDTGFGVVEIGPAQYHVPDRDFRAEAWKPL